MGWTLLRSSRLGESPSAGMVTRTVTGRRVTGVVLSQARWPGLTETLESAALESASIADDPEEVADGAEGDLLDDVAVGEDDIDAGDPPLPNEELADADLRALGDFGPREAD